LYAWSPSLPSFVSNPKAAFSRDVLVDGAQVKEFTYSYSSQQARQSESWVYRVTPEGIPVSYAYGESNPMGGSSVNIKFAFKTAEPAPSSC
jgi:hypothetical protein